MNIKITGEKRKKEKKKLLGKLPDGGVEPPTL